MAAIEIIAAGRMRAGPQQDLCLEYRKRITWKLSLTEIESKHKNAADIAVDEDRQLKASLKKDHWLIAMDERGKDLTSVEFAEFFRKAQNEAITGIQFVIGGADGLSDDLKNSARLMLGLGRKTWPHMLARVLLLEQIYRAQQILAGHPYHRD